MVTIQCDGCVAGKENNQVFIGDAKCEIMDATETEITCCPGKELFWFISSRL